MRELIQSLMPPGLQLLSWQVGKKVLECHVKPTPIAAPCPICGHPSCVLHSTYERTVVDLPATGLKLRFRIQARKFFCTNKMCPRRVFCARLSGVKAYGRKTLRFFRVLQSLSLQLSAQTCTRVIRLLGTSCSRDCFLRYARQYQPEIIQSEHIGIDDWAKRKSMNYGTIVVDLDSHRVLDLLDSRDQEDLIPWMKQHPEVKLVSRDRAFGYQDVTNRCGVIAVTDRWHLMKNLSEAFGRCIEPHFKNLRVRVQKRHSRGIAPSAKPLVEGAQTGSPSGRLRSYRPKVTP